MARLHHELARDTGRNIMDDSLALVSVVDDDESVRESLPDLLKMLGLAVEAFASAEGLLNAGLVDETGCLILDVMMPGMSGRALQRELQRRGIPRRSSSSPLTPTHRCA